VPVPVKPTEVPVSYKNVLLPVPILALTTAALLGASFSDQPHHDRSGVDKRAAADEKRAAEQTGLLHYYLVLGEAQRDAQVAQYLDAAHAADVAAWEAAASRPTPVTPRQAPHAPVKGVTGAHRAPQGTPRGTARAPATSGGSGDGWLSRVRQCESGGNYAASTGNGFYGAYQFTLGTWQSVGGSGNPAAASPAEQDARASALRAQSGSSPWPVCG